MLVLISGSVNAGKSSTAKLLAEKLGAEFLDFDELEMSVPDFSLEKDIPKVIRKGIEKINQLTDTGNNVVASCVLREEDYRQILKGVKTKQRYFFTLAPRLEIVQSDRGRGLSDWEHRRIKYHYDTGIANPPFGSIIDNSDMSLEETVDKIVSIMKANSKQTSV